MIDNTFANLEGMSRDRFLKEVVFLKIMLNDILDVKQQSNPFELTSKEHLVPTSVKTKIVD